MPPTELPAVFNGTVAQACAWIGTVLFVGLGLRGIVRPVSGMRGGGETITMLLSSAARIIAFAASLLMITSLLVIISARDDLIGMTARWIVLFGYGVAAWFAALFVLRQFLAPPWWRLNAWDPADSRTRNGVGIRSALQWVAEDVRDLGRSLRPIERFILFAGMPLTAINIARVFGPQATLLGVYAILALMYLTLVMVLFSANRIPRSLLTRLQELRQVARHIAGGDLSARVRYLDTAEYQELGELVADINSMARSLETREREYAALTQQLNSALHFEQERASRDQLTQLHNHRYFQEALAAELYRCSRTGEMTTIAVIDLDDFKAVNDTYGHQEGDAVLIRTAQAFTDTLRPYDLPARLGGEEFGVIFPSTTPEEAKVVMDRIMDALATAGPNGSLQTFSGGIATFPIHATEQTVLYQLADSSAYAAKLNGKRHTVVFDPGKVLNVAEQDRVNTRERDAQLKAAQALVQTVDTLEGFPHGHSERVGSVASKLAVMLGFDDAFARDVYLGGLMHDVGKLGLDKALVRKAEQLTPQEFELVKRHPELSAQIIENAGLPEVAAWVRHHHEHFDGSGYPSRLAGHRIPIQARIVLVSEAFHVMVSDRPYRMALTTQQAIGELMREAGTRFDPDVVAAMIQLVRTGGIELPAAAGSMRYPAA